MKVIKDTLIHIGIHKAGSTFIQKQMLNNIENAEIITFLEENKYSNFVDYIQLTSDQYFNINKIINDINELNKTKYENIIISSEGFSGRGTLAIGQGFSMKTICNRLNKIFINAKILIVLRNQKDAIMSFYKDDIKFGYTISFNEWLKRRLKICAMNYFYYSKIIKIYQETFGQENVNIVFFEELFGEEAINTILEKTNLSYKSNTKINFNKRDNLSLSNIGLWLFRLLNKFNKTKLNTLTDTGINTKLKIYNFYRNKMNFLFYKFGNRKIKQTKLFRQVLIEKFLEDNKEVEKIIGRKLPSNYYFN